MYIYIYIYILCVHSALYTHDTAKNQHVVTIKFVREFSFVPCNTSIEDLISISLTMIFFQHFINIFSAFNH